MYLVLTAFEPLMQGVATEAEVVLCQTKEEADALFEDYLTTGETNTIAICKVMGVAESRYEYTEIGEEACAENTPVVQGQ